jgi:N-acetylglucosamine-6-phosphate deacetylase
MRTCPACGSYADETDRQCPICNFSLVSPATDAPAAPAAPEPVDLVPIGAFTRAEAITLSQELHLAGLPHTIVPSPELPIAATQPCRVLVPAPLAGAAWALITRVRLSPEELTILSGAEIFLPDGVFAAGTVILGDGHILDVLDSPMSDPGDGSRFLDLTGYLLAPGFIDIHLHGMHGIDVNAAGAADWACLSREAARHGTTTLLPTTVACPHDALAQILASFRAAGTAGWPGARLLGLHLESNFINDRFKGAQPRDALCAPASPQGEALQALILDYAEEIRLVTLAPEVPGALACIERLCAAGILVSLGHSGATYEEACAGFAAGATHVTHLFNAMAPLHHRTPGLVGAALENDAIFVEMVCDGVHIHPAVIATTITAKGAERFIPITDGLAGAGLPEGTFALGGRPVHVRDGVARLADGTIAGSIATMETVLGVLVDTVGWDLGEALALLAATPADGLGRADLGRIAQGSRADLVVLDPTLQVIHTFVEGACVYSA